MAQARSGKTVKVSVSLHKDDLAALERRARDAFDGNLSAAVAEAARWLRQQEARHQLIEMLGGSTLTDAARVAIDAEQAGGPRHQPRRGRAKRAA